MPVVECRSGTSKGGRNSKVGTKRKVVEVEFLTSSESSNGSSSSSGSENEFSEEYNSSSSDAMSDQSAKKRQKKITRSKRAKVFDNGKYEDNENEEFYVEEILDMRMQNNKTFFLVKWLGFPDNENSWEPEENMTDCNDIIKDFMNKKEARPKKEINEKIKILSKNKIVGQKSVKVSEDKSIKQVLPVTSQGNNCTGTTTPKRLIYVFRILVDDQVQLLYLDLAQKHMKEEYYSIVLTEDLQGKDPKWFYGATEGVDGSKYCLVQFEGSECIDVVAPVNLINKFPYVKNFYEHQGHYDLCPSA